MIEFYAKHNEVDLKRLLKNKLKNAEIGWTSA